MLSRAQLDDAVTRQIIDAEQRDQLIALADGTLGARAERPQAQSLDENMRLIGGGNDVFVTIGVVMLGAGLLAALMTVIGDQRVTVFAIMAVFLWAVAEFVTRQRRMRLASTVIGLGFVFAVQAILTDLIIVNYDLAIPDNPLQLAAMRPQLGMAGTLFLGGIALSAALYFWRFRVPIMAGVIALCLTGLAFFYVTLFLYDGVTEGRLYMPALDDLPELLRNALYMPLISGLVIFAVGVAFDLHDRERVTVWSDCAFWLHVISAPLLVHPLFIMSTGQDVVFGEIEPGTGAMVMLAVLIAAFVYVALAIDRRSLLIPTLAYFGSLGIYYLINSAANQTGIPPFALILLVVGALIIMFGAGWQRIRSLIIGPTLPTSLLDKLPPIRVQSV
ncbi:hypothetical protein [Roseitalea porphyridii]|uniref:DUF2157 domain-containing protein n=1 Tax=Roseitalea porphyridii TaxID=1852022 RepID=A0A4P6UWT6_9HYPH|nr:hypothetical protein [Roseitalea porphyridii]QBK29275.1 hypothetical protein E0E05_00895 [Roseitalea porphyridii]